MYYFVCTVTAIFLSFLLEQDRQIIRMEIIAETLEEQIENIQKENDSLKEELEKYKKLNSYIREKIEKANKTITPEELQGLTLLFWDQVKLYNIDPWQAASWLMQESEYKITAISCKGAIGLAQVMPATGQEVARKLGIEWNGRDTLLDPEQNLRIGFYYLDWCRKRPAVITEHQTFTAYCWGIGNVKRKGLDVTAYSKEILERAEIIRKV